MPETTLRRKGTGLAIVDKQVLIAIVAQLEWNACLVDVCGVVVFHLVFWEKPVECPPAVQVDFALQRMVGLQLEVNVHIVAFGVNVYVVAIADEESAVGILVVEVVGARQCLEGIGMVVGPVPSYMVDTH